MNDGLGEANGEVMVRFLSDSLNFKLTKEPSIKLAQVDCWLINQFMSVATIKMALFYATFEIRYFNYICVIKFCMKIKNTYFLAFYGALTVSITAL
jgi:hypothetical protein